MGFGSVAGAASISAATAEDVNKAAFAATLGESQNIAEDVLTALRYTNVLAGETLNNPAVFRLPAGRYEAVHCLHLSTVPAFQEIEFYVNVNNAESFFNDLWFDSDSIQRVGIITNMLLFALDDDADVSLSVLKTTSTQVQFLRNSSVVVRSL